MGNVKLKQQSLLCYEVHINNISYNLLHTVQKTLFLYDNKRSVKAVTKMYR